LILRPTRLQPVAFTENGIETLLGDRVRQRIAWRDLDRIEKRAWRELEPVLEPGPCRDELLKH
jgi:hypothetical protein